MSGEADNISTEPSGAAQSSGTDELDSLLAEFNAGVGAHDAGGGNGVFAAEDDDGPTVDQLTDESYWRQREQNAYAHQLNERASNSLSQLQQQRAEFLRERALAKHNSDLKTTIAEIRGELDPKFFSDELVTAWLDSRANADQRLQDLWLNREQNPRALQNAVKQLAREFTEKYTRMPDPEISADRAMVAAAVRGASRNYAPDSPAPSYGRQNNNDFRRSVAEQFGFDPLS